VPTGKKETLAYYRRNKKRKQILYVGRGKRCGGAFVEKQ
jgi:hypothetical protein